MPEDRTLRLCVFSASLERRAITMSIRSTPICFYEHAARQYLVPGGNEHKAAVRVIALRLVRTLLMPVLAVEIDGRAVGASKLSIPLSGGLLLGGFADRPLGRQSQGVGCKVTYGKRGQSIENVPLGMTVDFVVKTFVDGDKLGNDQLAIVREVDAWLEEHQGEAEHVMLNHFRLDLDQGDMRRTPAERRAGSRLQADERSRFRKNAGNPHGPIPDAVDRQGIGQ